MNNIVDIATTRHLIKVHELDGVVIQKPDPDNITEFGKENTPGISLQAFYLSLKIIQLGARILIPVHKNPATEKCYIWNEGGPGYVYIYDNDRWSVYQITESFPVFVPAGLPHAIHTSDNWLDFWVVSTMTDKSPTNGPSDVIWDEEFKDLPPGKIAS